MDTFIVIRWLAALSLLVCVGCGAQTGPPSVSQTSAATPELADRVNFVEQFVKFRPQYSQLEYNIFYKNNSGGLVPGPSDWDIRLAAKVHPDEIADWISNDMIVDSTPSTKWHLKIGTEIDVTNVVEWHTSGGRSVGVDRLNSVVVYRNSTMGQ